MASILSTSLCANAAADPLAPDDRTAMRAELEALREANESLERRLLELERQLGGDAHSSPDRVEALDSPAPEPADAAIPGGSMQSGDSALDRLSRLSVSGDLRLRYEANSEDAAGQARHRGVVRGRLSARWRANDWLTAGARLVTGDLDDPNTADVTLSNLDDDLKVGLDQLFLRADRGASTVFAGKHPNIFTRTDLVWDGDVMLQGAALEHRFTTRGDAQINARAAYFLIDEAPGGDDSAMTGIQAEAAGPLAGAASASLAVSYFHYDLGRLASAGPGDFRGNRLGPNGRYLSDFEIANLIADITVEPFGEQWPVRGRLDLARNFAALGGAEDAWAVDLFVGRAEQAGDVRLRYGYAETEQDAVFAAFSHDNIPLSTDYRLHTLSLDAPLAERVDFNLTAYAYSALSVPGDWDQRARFNLVVGF
jgi:hypothetical protein